MPSVPSATVQPAARRALDVEAPDAVVGVRLGAVDEYRLVAGDDGPALRREMDPVHQERAIVEETSSFQSFEWCRTEGQLRHLEIEGVFGHVDVTTATNRPAAGHFVEGRVGECETGVKTDGAAQPRVVLVAIDEAEIFDEPGDRLVVTVAVGDLVAQDTR